MSASEPTAFGDIDAGDIDAWARRLYLDSRPETVARSTRRSLLALRLVALAIVSAGCVTVVQIWSVHGPVPGVMAAWALPLVVLAAVLAVERLLERR
jgi:hypothetical protein